jgi:DNA-binding transcriptional LysR family regulator
MAAVELAVTHGAVSKQLDIIEDWIRVPLFTGGGRRLKPTVAAQNLARAANEAWRLIESTAEEIASPGEYVILHVTAPTTFAMRWLIPRLPLFHALHPAVKVSVRQTEEMEPWTDIPFDIAIRRGGEIPPRFRKQLLLTEKASLLASPRLLGDEADLADLPLLRSESRRGQLQSWLRAAGLPTAAANRARNLPHLYIALEAALSGQGALVAPINVLQDVLNSGVLVKVRPDIVLHGPDYRLVYNEITERSAAGAAFLEWILEEGLKSD